MTVLAQQPSESSPLTPPLKVMSFNIRYGAARDGENHWDHRANLVAETIQVFDPDLLGTQEVLKFQAEFLQQQLPGYAFHGVGRQDGTEEGEYVPVMYRKSRFELVDSGFYWLSETPDVAGSKSWDSSLPRMASWVQLRDRKANNAEFVFINTHFDHRGQTARLESARLIRRHVEKLQQQNIPVVVVGDFNTNEDGKPYQALLNGSDGDGISLVDTYRQSHPQRSKRESSFGSWTGDREGSRIDWILHSPEFKTLVSTINYTNADGRYPSDHYPVQAVLRLKTKD